MKTPHTKTPHCCKRLKTKMNSKHSSSSSPKSVLVIGTKPCVSMQRLRQLSFLSNNTTQVHLLCHPASNPHVSEQQQQSRRHLFTSIMRGDESNPRHIEKALAATKASVVIIPMAENAHQAMQQQQRDETRLALAQVLGKPEFSRVQVLAISQTSTAVITYEKRKVSSSPRNKSPSSLASGSSRHSSSTTSSSHSSSAKSKPSQSTEKVPKPPVRDHRNSRMISI